MTITNHLKRCRLRENISQQDVAFLLGISPTHLVRYETGERNPTPEIIIIYHILFRANLKELFAPIYSIIENNLIQRSLRLVDELKVHPSPKSTQTIAYLQNLVKSLTPSQTYDADK